MTVETNIPDADTLCMHALGCDQPWTVLVMRPDEHHDVVYCQEHYTMTLIP
jgi:hypothetical protein